MAFAINQDIDNAVFKIDLSAPIMEYPLHDFYRLREYKPLSSKF
jgi:hypothetical protein